MDFAEITVVALSAVGILLIGWYFLWSESRPVASFSFGSESQVVNVNVNGGYDPSRIEALAGKPLAIRFMRDSVDSCSETVVFPSLGVSRRLPTGKETEVELGSLKPGKYPFECSMGMIRGELVVKGDE